MIATERLLEVFVEAADTLVADYDVIDFLHNLADHTAAISDASSVGLLLGDANGKLQFMAASSAGVQHLELFQLQRAEGPCLDCFQSGEPVIVSDLGTAAERWPAFVPRARELGLNSVHAFPMRLRDRVIGTLNVFGERQLPLEASDVQAIQALTDIATIGIIQERAIVAAELLTEQLQGALTSRVVIEQAKGVVAQSTGTSVDEAFLALRRHARGNGLRLTDVANAVLTDQLDPATLVQAPAD